MPGGPTSRTTYLNGNDAFHVDMFYVGCGICKTHSIFKSSVDESLADSYERRCNLRFGLSILHRIQHISHMVLFICSGTEWSTLYPLRSYVNSSYQECCNYRIAMCLLCNYSTGFGSELGPLG